MESRGPDVFMTTVPVLECLDVKAYQSFDAQLTQAKVEKVRKREQLRNILLCGVCSNDSQTVDAAAKPKGVNTYTEAPMKVIGSHYQRTSYLFQPEPGTGQLRRVSAEPRRQSPPIEHVYGRRS
ncbi:hypothetical protein HaLaN_16928 [Haematococcus lacustris]|uniref:Uncharacterized protein n=1 Tax=Haematococcus lacustris TaxID=44745 RepID=A0A699ZJZ4_HAELA|nr:hypothetical protein HaLaN_16928 [Haematococcus lacustris]